VLGSEKEGETSLVIGIESVKLIINRNSQKLLEILIKMA